MGLPIDQSKHSQGMAPNRQRDADVGHDPDLPERGKLPLIVFGVIHDEQLAALSRDTGDRLTHRQRVSLDEVLRRLRKVVHGGERHPPRLLVHKQHRPSLHAGQRNHSFKGEVQDHRDV